MSTTTPLHCTIRTPATDEVPTGYSVIIRTTRSMRTQRVGQVVGIVLAAAWLLLFLLARDTFTKLNASPVGVAVYVTMLACLIAIRDRRQVLGPNDVVQEAIGEVVEEVRDPTLEETVWIVTGEPTKLILRAKTLRVDQTKRDYLISKKSLRD